MKCLPMLLALTVIEAFVTPPSFSQLRLRQSRCLVTVQAAGGFGKPATKGGKKKLASVGSPKSLKSSPTKAKKKGSTSTDDLWKIVSTGKAELKSVKSILRSGVDFSRVDSEGYSLLHIACRGGMAGVAKMLLEAGADANALGGGARARPLHLAALGNHADVVDVLLAGGAEVDGKDEGEIGGTALHYAANAGAHSVIETLLKGGASVAAMSGDGRSVLQFASFCADATVAERLEAAGAPPLPQSEPWPRDRPVLEVLGRFARYSEVAPRVEACAVPAGGVFASHDVLHFEHFDGADPAGPPGLAVHRFRLLPDDQRGTGRAPGALDAALVRAARAMRERDPAGALRSNQGGYHSAATLRGREEDEASPCWGELHEALDAAAAAAVEAEAAAGRLPAQEGGEALRVTDSWVNLNRGRGDFNKLHMHVPAVYSGVYYVQPPDDALGRLNGAFVLPLTTSGEELGEGEAGGDSEVSFALLRAERGMLLLFPARMLHAVLPSWAPDGAEPPERVSVAFNVSPNW